MQTNIDYYAVADYAQKFSEKLCNAFFEKSEYMRGDDILGICENEQVGFFALGTIFLKWQDEIDEMRSPYFDYESDAVADALQKVANILSRNIKLNKESAIEIFEDAVEDTLLAVISPYHFMRKNFSTYPIIPIHHKIEAYLKYVLVHKPLYNEIFDFIDKKEPDHDIEPRQMRLAVSKVLDETDYEYKKDIRGLLDSLNSILPLEVDQLFEKESKLEEIEDIDPEEAEREPDHEALAFDIETGEENLTHQTTSEETTLADHTSIEQQDEPATQPEATSNSHSKIEETSKPDATSETIDFVKSRHQSNSEERPRLLKDSISLHKKFAFINELFDGNSNEFNEAITLIDECSDYHKAIQLVKEKYFRRYNWDLEKSEVKDFYELLSQRF